ncbi:MAG TPA: ankyrin repeat domain-containing protein [Candidatus Limnocylindrales bacterium]|nr:ankyrin repeat domain-containing protein [Candidatus Limnocylindrales bacterium]
MSVTELFDAIDKRDQGRLSRLVAEHPDVAGARDTDGVSAMLHARYRENLAAVETLLAANPPVDVFDAAALGRTGRLRGLIAADPSMIESYSADGFTPLHLAAFFGQAETTRVLIHAGSDVNAVSRNAMKVRPLNSAAAARRDEVARMLIEAGADVSSVMADGFTPLHAAAQNGDIELIDLLLDRGARLDARTGDGQTSADVAEKANHPMLAKRLRAGVAS